MPKEWQHMRDPVVPLQEALYGHPRSSACWENHCETILKAKGFEPIPQWRSCFRHAKLGLFLTIYVDDFKLARPKEAVAKGWDLIKEGIELDEPQDINKYLGCTHVVGNKELDGKQVRTMAYDMCGFMEECVSVYLECVGATTAEQKLKTCGTQ